jgi:hypothetical protein
MATAAVDGIRIENAGKKGFGAFTTRLIEAGDIVCGP